MEVKCPACGKPAVFKPENPYRPFCSQRCKLIDLGAWADESYRVPVKGDALDDSPESEIEDIEADDDSSGDDPSQLH